MTQVALDSVNSIQDTAHFKKHIPSKMELCHYLGCVENGQSIFAGNCAACHAGGNNSVVPEKKIKKEALVTYGKYDIAASVKQVTNGYGSMPAFGERLGPDDIDDVAAYVYGQADKW